MVITMVQTWLLLLLMAMIFALGLCWCFCCGTCVGRSMLRNMGLVRFARDGADDRQWNHLPLHTEEESWHLNTWPEEDEESE